MRSVESLPAVRGVTSSSESWRFDLPGDDSPVRGIRHAAAMLRRTLFYCDKDPEFTDPMQIIVRDNNVDQALRALKKKLQREGVYREMKLRRHYEKPSEKRARERAAAVRRARKLERKRMERDSAR
jgi:small subunit ribosomal protein S21